MATAQRSVTADQALADALSFTRGLFAGAIHDELLFPYPASLDQRARDEAKVLRRLIADLRELAHSRIDEGRIDEEEALPEEVIGGAAKIGLLGLTIPRQYGGLGLSATGYARIFGEISVTDASLAVLVGVHCGLGSKAIVLFGSDAQKERYLPALARGEMLAAYALTEPEIGSDAQHIRARAVRADDDRGWLLSGRKIWIGNAHRAGVIVTFAQTVVPRRGTTVERPTGFLIRPDMPGFRVVGTVRKLGIRGSTQAELDYDRVAVPDDHVLGTVGKGFTVAVHVLNAGRLTLAAGCTAGTKRLLGEMARFAERRIQFSRPIAAFEITQRKLARTAADLYAAEAMLGALAAMVDRNDSDFSLEVACAKVFASDMIWRTADEMVQVAGGRGFVKPYPYERMLRDARINRIFEGTNEVLRLFISLNGIQTPAAQLRELGSALRRPLRNLGLLSGYAAARFRSALGASTTLDAPLHARLERHARYFEQHVAELKSAVERMLIQYRETIIDRQMVLERLADMAIELVATAAVISRTQRLLEERGEAQCERELALCDLFCVEAGWRFREQRTRLDAADDDLRRAVATHVRSDAGYAVSDALLTDEGASRPPPGKPRIARSDGAPKER